MLPPARARAHHGVAAAILAGSVLLVMEGRVACAESPGETPSPDQAAVTNCKPLSLHGSLANPRPGDLFLRAGRTTCDQAEVEVVADAVAGVFTASFDLRYPATLVKYSGFTVGPLLQRAPVATQPLCLVQESSPGVLQVTMTRFAPDRGVSSQGSETLLVLRFARATPGSGDVDFNLDPSSPVAERIVDDAGSVVAARFGPGHGLKLTVYQR
jgi:hypothetical protein